MTPVIVIAHHTEYLWGCGAYPPVGTRTATTNILPRPPASYWLVIARNLEIAMDIGIHLVGRPFS